MEELKEVQGSDKEQSAQNNAQNKKKTIDKKWIIIGAAAAAVVVIATVLLIVLLGGNGDGGETPACEHIDTNFDDLCDDCGEPYSVECTHVDKDYNKKCDNCYKPYTVRVMASFSIFDESGAPVSGVKFVIYKDGVQVAHMSTGESGKVTCDIEAGHYSINAEDLPEYWTSTASFADVEINESKKDFAYTAINNTPDGSLDKPYAATDAATGENATKTLAAGTSAAFITKGESRYLIIRNSAVTVTYKETEYVAEGGEIRIFLESAESTNEMIVFVVNNNTDGDQTVAIDFEYIPGTVANPYDAVVGTEYTVDIVGSSTVYYKLVADKEMKITATCSAGGSVTLYNETTYAQAGTEDESCNLTVHAGDVIQIRISVTNTKVEANHITSVTFKIEEVI